MPVPGPIPFGGSGVRPGVRTRAVAAAGAAEVDFGTDISFLDDLDPLFGLVSGTDNLGQALVHRLSTPRESLPWDKNYGTDLRGYVNETMTPAKLAAAKADAQAECIKDERVLACLATVNFDTQAKSLLVQLVVQTSAGPFAFVLAVTDVTVELLQPAT